MKKYHSIHADAPELLLDEIAKLGSVLENYKAKQGETQQYLDFKRVLDVMKYAWTFMKDTETKWKEVLMLESRLEFLEERNEYLANRLLLFEAIEKLKLTGELEEVAAKVDKYMNYRNEMLDIKEHETIQKP